MKFEFKTYGDKVLIHMLRAAGKFMAEVKAGGSPRWLSIVGVSDTGKTHLARRIFRQCVTSGKFRTEMTSGKTDLCHPHQFTFWPRVADQLQRGIDDDDYYDARNVQVLVLDDIGAVKDTTGFVTSKLSVLIGMRENKWTVITANLGPEEISNTLDARIASRMVRGKNVLVQAKTLPHTVRKK